MRVVSVVGARPQFVKLAPMDKALAENEIEHCVIHTGQHYDRRMSDIFFEEMMIPKPKYNLNINQKLNSSQIRKWIAAPHE